MSNVKDMNQQAVGEKEQERTVTVHNEDNGRPYTLHVGRGETIGKIIEQVYKKMKLERQPGDRLRCEAGGEDVFAFSEIRLRDYLDAGHCPDLVWLFAGDTGGA